MRLNRVIAGTVAAGLLGLVPVTAAAPANAATATTSASQAAHRAVVYGKRTTIYSKVVGTNGSAADGTVTLQSKLSTSSTWKNVRSATLSGGVANFTGVKPAQNTSYRISYAGSATYAPSISNVSTVKVGRKVTAPRRGFTLRGTVSPKYAKKPIIISVSKRSSSGFKKFKTIRTNRKSQYTFKLPKRRGTWYWRVMTKADKKFIANGYAWRTSVY